MPNKFVVRSTTFIATSNPVFFKSNRLYLAAFPLSPLDFYTMPSNCGGIMAIEKTDEKTIGASNLIKGRVSFPALPFPIRNQKPARIASMAI